MQSLGEWKKALDCKKAFVFTFAGPLEESVLIYNLFKDWVFDLNLWSVGGASKKNAIFLDVALYSISMSDFF